MLGVLEDLFYDSAGSDSALPRLSKVLNVNIQVHGCPVPLVTTKVPCLWGRLGAGLLLQKADSCGTELHYDHAWHRHCRL